MARNENFILITTLKIHTLCVTGLQDWKLPKVAHYNRSNRHHRFPRPIANDDGEPLSLPSDLGRGRLRPRQGVLLRRAGVRVRGGHAAGRGEALGGAQAGQGRRGAGAGEGGDGDAEDGGREPDGGASRVLPRHGRLLARPQELPGKGGQVPRGAADHAVRDRRRVRGPVREHVGLHRACEERMRG